MARGRKRITRKELKEDEVAEFFAKVVLYFQRNARRIVGISLVVVVAIIIAVVAIKQRRTAELDAQFELAQANLQLKAGNFATALAAYGHIRERYRGTWSSSDVTFFAASAYFAAGRYDTAMVLFENYLHLGRRRPEFTVSARLGIAQCLEELGRYGEAADNYLKVQREYPESPLAPDALLGAARCYELAGNLEEAARFYDEVLTAYPDSRQAQLARMPLLEIRSLLERS